MKILVCASEYYPYGSGIANVAYNVVEQLKNIGVDCTVCSPTGPDIKLKSVNGYGRLTLIHFWHKVSTYYKRSEIDYDVVWLHNPLFMGKNPFKKCLVTIHTTPYGQIVKRMYPWHIHIYKAIASKIDKYCLNKMCCDKIKFVAIDPQIIDELEVMNIKNVALISNGVDIHRFKPSEDKKIIRSKFNIPNDAIVLLSVGRLTAMKMPFRMIEIFDEIQKTSERYMLFIAGKGELFESARKNAMNKNIRNINFLGFVPEADLVDLYACSDYYIIISKYEGQPLTLLEAMSSGLPCIVSDIPNLRIVEDANCGIIVDFNIVEKAAEEIIVYFKRDKTEHSKNAREHAMNNLDWKIIARKYLKEFERVLSE